MCVLELTTQTEQHQQQKEKAVATSLGEYKNAKEYQLSQKSINYYKTSRIIERDLEIIV